MISIANSLKVQTEINKLLYKHLSVALCAESLAAVCLTIVLWGSINNILLCGWLAFRLVICGLGRSTLLLCYRKFNSRAEASGRITDNSLWLDLFAVGAFLSGINWGAVGSVLMVPHDMVRQTFCIFVLFGATSAANPLNSPSRRVYAIFLFSACLPFLAWLMVQGGSYIILGAMTTLYIAVMLATSSYTCRLISNSFSIRFKNSELLRHLSKAKHSLEKRSRELEKSNLLVKASLESTTDGVLVVDSENNIEDFNKKFVSMWNIAPVVMAQKNSVGVIDVICGQITDPAAFRNKFTELHNNPTLDCVDEVMTNEGKIIERSSHPQLVGDKCVGRVWRFRDVTERKILEEKLLHQANYDSLTGLPNRTLACDRIMQAILGAKRSHTVTAILFLDLDGFKLINDTLGHRHGDMLLKEVAERLVKCVRANDTVSRVGGDEFIMILNGLKNDEEASNVARKCLEAVSDAYIIDNNKYTTSISIGVSIAPRDGQDADTLIRNADIAMYRAKELGKNNFQFFTEEMNKKVKTRLMMENQLRDALEKKQFSLMYQPIATLNTGKIVGVEALLRWDHPVWGPIQPKDFIPVAEESGVIIAISNWVLRTASAQLNDWRKAEIPPLQMAVNLSARHFKQLNFLDQVKGIINEAGIDPRYIALELTENMIMDNVEKSIQTLTALREMGFAVVIDDFGIGYSSLNHLKNFPADKIKIHSQFIHELSNHAADAAITAAIIALAGELNLKVVAEGVESDYQLKFLSKHNCDEVQGYYFSAPLNKEACTNLLFEEATLSVM